MANTHTLVLAAMFFIMSLLAVDARSGNTGGRGSGRRQGCRGADALKYYSSGYRTPTADQLVGGMEVAVAGKAFTTGNRRLLSMKLGDQPRQATALLDQPRKANSFDALSPPAVSKDQNARKLLLARGSNTQIHGAAEFGAHNGLSAIAHQVGILFPYTASRLPHCLRQVQ